MHILSVLLSCFSLFVAIAVIRQTIVSGSGRILEALAGVAPVRQNNVAVIVPFRARPRVLIDRQESTRIAA